jgi:hypothetical protein
MSAILEHNGHRRPGLLGLAAAPQFLSVAWTDLPELTVADVAELGGRLRASIRAGVRLPEPVLEVVLAGLLADGYRPTKDKGARSPCQCTPCTAWPIR